MIRFNSNSMKIKKYASAAQNRNTHLKKIFVQFIWSQLRTCMCKRFFEQSDKFCFYQKRKSLWCITGTRLIEWNLARVMVQQGNYEQAVKICLLKKTTSCVSRCQLALSLFKSNIFNFNGNIIIRNVNFFVSVYLKNKFNFSWTFQRIVWNLWSNFTLGSSCWIRLSSCAPCNGSNGFYVPRKQWC